MLCVCKQWRTCAWSLLTWSSKSATYCFLLSRVFCEATLLLIFLYIHHILILILKHIRWYLFNCFSAFSSDVMSATCFLLRGRLPSSEELSTGNGDTRAYGMIFFGVVLSVIYDRRLEPWFSNSVPNTLYSTFVWAGQFWLAIIFNRKSKYPGLRILLAHKIIVWQGVNTQTRKHLALRRAAAKPYKSRGKSLLQAFILKQFLDQELSIIACYAISV